MALQYMVIEDPLNICSIFNGDDLIMLLTSDFCFYWVKVTPYPLLYHYISLAGTNPHGPNKLSRACVVRTL